LTCNNCGSKSHPGLDPGECPFDEMLLKSLDYHKVISMIAKTEFETNNPKAIRARMNFLSNLPNYKKNSKRKKSDFPSVESIDDMEFEELRKWCYQMGVAGQGTMMMKKALKLKLNMNKTKQTPRGEIRTDFLLACNIEGHGEYDHVFHMKDLTPDELQNKLGTMCGYVHGDGKKCGGRFVSRINR